MKGLLVRVAIDQAFGRWNGLVDPSGRFVYVPIPEKPGTLFHPGLERRYGEVLPALHRLCLDNGRCLYEDMRFPQELLDRAMHLDPDFECLTYGDRGNTRGHLLHGLSKGDFVVFYSGLRPIHPCDQKLVYAIIGMFVVKECVLAAEAPPGRWFENAHLRKTKRGENDILVRAEPAGSGRLERCIPVGRWRDGAYRVLPDLLVAWGGLSVKDGFIQRSAVPPAFCNPARFRKWFEKQDVGLIHRNN